MNYDKEKKLDRQKKGFDDATTGQDFRKELTDSVGYMEGYEEGLLSNLNVAMENLNKFKKEYKK